MLQGEIWDVNFSPTEGAEQSGIRPAVIISGNIMNIHYDVVIVCPLTSKIKNLRGNIVLLPDDRNGIKKKSEVLVFHVKSVSKNRLKFRRGSIPWDHLIMIKENLNKILDY